MFAVRIGFSVLLVISLFSASPVFCETSTEAKANQDRLEGQVEKIDGDKRIARPVSQLKVSTPSRGKDIFNTSNFDLSAKKSSATLQGKTEAATFNLFQKIEKQPDTVINTNPPVSTELNQLKKYKVFFVIDCSGSMKIEDCFVDDHQTQNIFSRWDWTAQELRGFANQTQTILKDGVDIIAFNGGYRRMNHCHENELKNVFSDINPSGSTLIGGALQEVFHSRHFLEKSLLLVIIGDGAIQDPDAMEQEILYATRDKSADTQIKILMLQVGHDWQAILNYQSIVKAVQDMEIKNCTIHFVPFEELRKIGVSKAIETMLTSN